MMNIFGATVYVLIVGVCTACSKGFFSDSSGKCIKCAQRCAFCDYSSCYKCASGFFGKYCENDCSYCQPGTDCNGEGFCFVGCKDGLSGKHCNVSCGSRCQSCDRHNPENCVQCRNIQSCDLACPVNCQGHSCNGSYCTEGCSPGSWGQSCQKYCPEKCSRVGCDRENGTCHKGFDVPVVASFPNVALPVMSVLLVTLSGLLFAMFLWKRRSARHQNLPVVVYKPKNRRRLMETENRSGTSEESMATSKTVDVQDNVAQFFGNNELSYFSPLSRNDDLQNQYKPLAEPICATRSETDISERQRLTQKTVGTADESTEIQYEAIQDFETHSSDAASAYITPIN